MKKRVLFTHWMATPIEQTDVVQSVLTKSVLGDDGLRLQRVSNAIFIDPTDSEDVLVALDEPGHVNDAVHQLLRHHGPHDAAGFPFLHDVMGHHRSALVGGRRPHDGDVVCRHLLELNLSIRWAWLV